MQSFSSDLIPRHARLDVLNDFALRHVAAREFAPIGEDLRVDIAALPLRGGAVVASARYSPIAGHRRRSHLADGREDYLLTVHSEAYEISVDGEPAVTNHAGEMMIVSEAACSEFRLPHVCVEVIALKREHLDRLVPRLAERPGHTLHASTPGLALLRGYARLLRHSSEAGIPDEAATTHLLDLAAFVLRGTSTAETGWRESSVRAARLALIKTEIDKHLRDPDLNIAAIAHGQRISPRYLQRLFKQEGTTFSDHVRGRRLDLAMQLLREANPREVRISSIAYDAGFGDLSNFNREFRRRFGMVPSDVRAEALRRLAE